MTKPESLYFWGGVAVYGLIGSALRFLQFGQWGDLVFTLLWALILLLKIMPAYKRQEVQRERLDHLRRNIRSLMTMHLSLAHWQTLTDHEINEAALYALRACIDRPLESATWIRDEAFKAAEIMNDKENDA